VTLDEIGFEKDDEAKFTKAIRAPWGMCLVTGATGSGKTTTLYASLNELNTVDVNISTIEDPVEYNFAGINQVQVKEHIGLTFPETLRALLRQDPDIILLGEIRDSETALIAMKAALTGHMVLSTLHTNDAPSSIMRLKDMGIDTFLINAAVHVIVAQRLVRRVCKECAKPDAQWTSEKLQQMGFPASLIGKFQPMKGEGCAVCNKTGYKGRVAIHEVMVMSENIRDAVSRNAPTGEIRKIAVAEGMKTLRVNCMRKVVKGLVCVDEIGSVGDGH
jgi:type IV pilus assembly protein PilB